MLPLRDHQPRSKTPIVTGALIVLNVLAFVYELSLGERLEGFLMSAAFVPERSFAGELPAPQLVPALLSMFLHGGWAHIGGNMLFLWIFGDNVEDRLGHLRFLAFYLLCGLAATWAHAVANPASAVPTVGASGAIAGVLGAYLFLHPRARITTLVFLGFFVTTIEVPALVYLAVWFLIQFASGLTTIGARTAEQAGGVAWFAHVGGFVAGPLLLLLLGGRRRPRRRRQAPAAEERW